MTAPYVFCIFATSAAVTRCKHGSISGEFRILYLPRLPKRAILFDKPRNSGETLPSSNPTLSAIQSLRRCDDFSDKKPRLNSDLLPRHPRQCRTYCNRRRIPRANARCARSCRSIQDTNCLDGDEPTYEIAIPSLGKIELLRVISAYRCRPPDPGMGPRRTAVRLSPGCNTRLVDGDGYWAGLSDCARCPRYRQGDLGPGRWGHGGV